MTRILLLTFALLLGAAAPLTSYRFAEGSRIWVEGTSTIHDWDCEATRFLGGATGTPDGARMSDLSAAQVTLDTRSIDCDNGTMNSKLRDALGKQPIRYELTSATPASAATGGWFTVETTGTLSIAGQSRPARISMRARALENGRYRFTGAHALHMTDFGVSPPTAMLGTLKTGDEVTVHFDVIVEPS
jgi:polyisoprenoid-binding protein YceI